MTSSIRFVIILGWYYMMNFDTICGFNNIGAQIYIFGSIGLGTELWNKNGSDHFYFGPPPKMVLELHGPDQFRTILGTCMDRSIFKNGP